MKNQVGSEWKGIWLTDKILIVEVNADNEIETVDGNKAKNGVTFRVTPEGETAFGRLIHKKRGEEDLRQWKTNKSTT